MKMATGVVATTLARASAQFRGVGLHTGATACAARVLPMPAGSGIIFELMPSAAHEGQGDSARGDRVAVVAASHRAKTRRIPAAVAYVAATNHATTLAAPDDPTVRLSTVEHLLAALSASSVDNALVQVTGPEVPILDGSSAPFMAEFQRCGLAPAVPIPSSSSSSSSSPAVAQREVLRIRRPVSVSDAAGRSRAWLLPCSTSSSSSSASSIPPTLSLSADVDFSARGLPRTVIATRLPDFARDLAACRTFAFHSDVARMRAAGLAGGGSLDNAVVFDDTSGRASATTTNTTAFPAPLNPGGLRRPDEWARHKLLDAVGDLVLAGRPIWGHYHGVRPGHAVNVRLVRKLLSDDANYEIVSLLSTRQKVDPWTMQ